MALSTLPRQVCLNAIPFEFFGTAKAYSVRKKVVAIFKGNSIEITFGDLKFEVRANVSRV